MKTTLKDIRRYVTTNVAEDLTKKNFSEIRRYWRTGQGQHHRQAVRRHRTKFCIVSGYVIGGTAK